MANNTWSVAVRRSRSGNWDVYFVGSDGKSHMIEGGFFSKRRAEECAEQARKDGLASEVEQAERKAGWSPNP